MRPKYVTERFGRWFIFGEWPNGLVGVNDGDRDVLVGTTRGEANAMIADRDRVIDALIDAIYGLSPEQQAAWLDKWRSPID